MNIERRIHPFKALLQQAALPGSLLTFLALTLGNNAGCLRYLQRFPAALSSQSIHWIWTQDLLPIVEMVLLFLLTRGLGSLLLRKLSAPRTTEATPLPVPWEGLALGLGLGTVAFSIFLLGIAQLLQPAVLSAVCLLGASLAWADFRNRRPDRLSPSNSNLLLFPPWKILCLIALLCSFRHVLWTALASPTEWDVLAYHLAIPKIYWSQGGIREIPWLVHSHWPHLMEALYVLPLSLRHDNLAALIHASLSAGLLFSTYSVAKHFWGDEGAWASAALLASQPIVLRFSGAAHSDGALACFYFLAAVCVWNGLRSGANRWFLLGGVLAGFCASAKLLGVILAALLALQILIDSRTSKRNDGSALRHFLLFSSCSFLTVLPWFLKTYAGTGNPFWPFLARFFGGRWGALSVTAAPPRTSAWEWLLDPERLSHDGPQFLVFPAIILTLLAIRGKKSSFPGFLRFLAFPVLPFFAIASLRDTGWRYCWPLFPFFALAAGWAFSEIWRRQVRWMKALSLGILAFGLWPALHATENNPLFEVLGLRSQLEPQEDPRTLYLERSLGIYRFCGEINKRFPRAKVLLFREIRGYYLDTPYIWGDPTNQGLIRYSELSDSAQLGRELDRLEVTHVWINEGVGMYRASPDYYTPHILDLMEGLLRSNSKPVLKIGWNTLYELHV